MAALNAIIVYQKGGGILQQSSSEFIKKLHFQKGEIFMAKYIDFKKVESSSESYIDLSGFR